MKLSSGIKIGIAASLTLFTTNILAEVTWGGFASIVGGRSPSNETLYSYDEDFSFNHDSLLGLQATTDLGNGFGATAQVIARGADDWETFLEWALLSYDVTDSWRLLFGRQRTPANMYSDYVDVSFAYPWLQPPRGLYSTSFDSYDGIGSIYNSTIGEIDSSLHIMVGRSSDNPFGDLVQSIDIRNYAIAAWTLEWQWLTLRVAYKEDELEVNFDTVDLLANNIIAADSAVPGANLTQLGNAMKMDGDSRSSLALGIKAEYEQLFFAAEHSDADNGASFLGNVTNWYAAIGWTFDAYMVHLTYGENETESNLNMFDVLPSLGGNQYIPTVGDDGVFGTEDDGFDFVTAPTARGVMASRMVDATYYTLGFRWSFHDAAAFNLEYTNESNDLIAGANDNAVLRFALVTVF